jgi:hypothetical protein
VEAFAFLVLFAFFRAGAVSFFSRESRLKILGCSTPSGKAVAFLFLFPGGLGGDAIAIGLKLRIKKVLP